MSDKKRTSISIDEDVYRFLKQSDINQSGLINELVKQYRDSDDRQIAALELRYEQTIADAEELQDRAERKFSEAEEIKALLDEARSEQSDELQQALDALEGKPPSVLTPDSKPVVYWSDQLDMDPSELVDYVRSNT